MSVDGGAVEGLPRPGTDPTVEADATPEAVDSDEPTLTRAEISIVTITKDDAAGIRKTIASVEQQDFSSYEHVVVDGGSSAGIAEWLASWRGAARSQRILVDDPPPGIYPAMNTGIECTTAPIILVLNGGDELAPGALRLVSEHHKLHRWRWAYGGVQGKDQQGRLRDKQTFERFSPRVFRAGLQPVPHQAAYVARSLYTEVGLYREDLGTAADQEFFLRAHRYSEPVIIPDVLAIVETWGVSTQETFIGREITWHRLRSASRTSFGGREATDLVVTIVLLGRLFFIRIIPKIRRIFTASRR